MNPEEWLSVVAVVGASLAMVGGMCFVFWHQHFLNRAFGTDSLRALGTVLFIPALIILATVAKLEASTLSALLGTVAGYLLSSGDSSKGGSQAAAKPAVADAAKNAAPK